MAFPAAHFLVGCGLGEVAHAAAGVHRWRAWIVGGALAVIPDVDLLLPIRHGTWTHSILALVVVTFAVWLLGGRRWGLLALASYSSHIVLDLLDGRGPTNVYLAWPFSPRRATAFGDIFPDASMALSWESLSAISVQTLIGAVGLLLLWLAARAIESARGKRNAG